MAPVVNQAREGGQGEARQAITPQFLSSYILLLLNNFFTRIPTALGTNQQRRLTTRRKGFCSQRPNIQTRFGFSKSQFLATLCALGYLSTR